MPGYYVVRKQFLITKKIEKMSTELVKSLASEVSTVTEQELIGHLENLGLVNKLTAGEKSTFIAIAKAFNLNPFKREIQVSKYGDKASIITGYEVYIKRAERSGLLDGWDCINKQPRRFMSQMNIIAQAMVAEYDSELKATIIKKA